MAQFLFKRSGTADKRPNPLQMALGEIDLNYNATTGGLFYKDSAGTLIKVGPAQVGPDAPNASPAGSSGNALGEFWFETVSGSLNIWDGTSWAPTSPGIGLASPTSPGVVYGLTEDTSLNVALGKGAGSNITTGLSNVAIGPNVAVASATGNCQLAIGYSATANWLTGDSTKAIKPGAGIIDCAGSCGTAGQVLSSNGANAIQWIAGGGISPSAFTQCGDILVGTGAGTYSALAVPRTFFPTVGIIDGNTLVSCGACAEGVAWGNPFISSAALVASTTGSIPVNGCDYGNSVCVASVLPGPGAPGQILTNAYDSGNPGYLAGQGYLNWCTPDFISQSSFGPGALVVGCTPGSTGGICTVGSVVNANNPGVAVGYYQGVTVTTCSGSGSGALATVNVINGGYFPIFDGVEITQPGTGYALGNSVGFVICGTTVTTQAQVCSLNQSTICKAGYLSVGTNGQVLTADSTCALGVKWAAAGGGGSGIPCACITGQGALVTGTAASTPVALAVGTVGQVLTVDLACASGLKWATPSAASAATPTVAGIVLGRSTATVTALGCNAGLNTTTGDNNTAVGCGALRFNVTGNNNTAVGDGAGSAMTGSGNTIVGMGALSGNTGNNSTAIGQSALAATTGAGNTALGWNAGTAVTTGAFNVIIGPILNDIPPYTPFNETGSCQLAIGFCNNCYWLTGTSTKAIRPGAGIIDCAGSCGTAGQVLMSNGSNAICWGAPAQATPTVLGMVFGRNDACSNVAYGQGALACMGTSGPFVGANVAVGCLAMACSTTGSSNVAIGLTAMCSTSGALFNVAIGPGALAVNTNGNCNIALGNGSASQLTGSWCNIAIGASALSSVAASVFDNVSIGTASLARATSCGNVAVGHRAGCDLTTGRCNVILGPSAQVTVATDSCQLAIGFSATDNWLTGTSTKAIKPGAGIIDCAGSCGTAGQVLMSNGSNAVCWGTAGGGGSAATPTVAGIVLGVTNATNVGLGCNALLSNTGTNNSALGLSAGCAITTGTCNVAIGNSVQVASATGSCQLAIGFSAADNWLIGDSTKAIKPGAGIIDCNNSCGTAGQALLSDGANAVVWGSAGVSPELFCCQNAAGCGSLGGNLIVGAISDGTISPVALLPGNPSQILTVDPINAANPLKWCTPNYLCGACFAKGSIPVGCAQVGGGIQTVTYLNQNNPGKPPGYYTNVPVSGGSGTGATVNVTIINAGYFPAVDAVEVASPGSGYLVGNSGLTMNIDGTTLSTTLTVASLNTNTIFNYTYLPVGTNNQVLTADSACTNGVKWAAPTVAAATPAVAGTVLAKTQSTGTSSTALGSGALNFAGVGACNVAVGLNAGCGVNNGACNTLIGSLAGDALTDGCSNTAVGFSALSAAATTSSAVAIGTFAMCRGTSAGTVAVGTCALKDLTNGVCNTAIGFAALSLNTTGQCNTAIGYRTLLLNVSGSRNTAIGEDALVSAKGSDNVAIGNSAGQSVDSSNGNTVVGSCAAVTASGSFNTVLGFQAYCDVNSPNGSNNIIIGCCAATPTGGVSGSLFGACNRIVMGNSAHSCAQIQIAWTTTSDVRDKALDPAGVPYGLLFVEQLEPIAYRWCDRCTNDITDEKLRYGFSAQNVRSLEGDEPVIVSDDNPDKLMITDQHLLPVLVNAIKELSEKNKLLEERIAALEDNA